MSYVFQNPPQAVANTIASTPLSRRKKYRDDGGGGVGGDLENRSHNIMCDRRVARGSTVVSRAQVTSRMPHPAAVHHRNTARSRGTKASARSSARSERGGGGPTAVAGRVHAEVQTHELLEELSDRPKQATTCTQTDKSKDRPMSPLFVPRLMGVSVATSIEPGDLFNFDTEVEPILEVLVGKALEQSLVEVLEEEEHKALQAYKREFEQKRNLAKAKVQQLEEAEARREHEKQQRFKQAEIFKKQVEQEKLRETAHTQAKQFLQSSITSALQRLDTMGVFYDPRRREIEEQFLPWLESKVAENLSVLNEQQHLVTDLIVSASEKALKQAEEADALIRERRRKEYEKIQEEKARREAEIARIEEDRLARIAAKKEKKRLAKERERGENTSDEDDNDDDESDEDYSSSADESN